MRQRRKMLLSENPAEAETLVVYDYDTAPQTLNGTVLSGSYTEIGSAGIKMKVIGSNSLSCVIGSYDLTGYKMLKLVGGKKDYAISSLTVSILNSAGAVIQSIELKNAMADNSMSDFNATSGNYSEHFLNVSGATGDCKIKLYISAGGTTQISLAAYRYIAFLASGSTDATVDRIIFTGEGDETSGYVTIDGTKLYSTTVLDLAHGAHSIKVTAYKAIINGVEHSAGSTDALIEVTESIVGNISISSEKTTESGIFGNTYYTITITAQ